MQRNTTGKNLRNTAVIMASLLAAGVACAATLPEAYERVAYIESTGTQYIDTGFTLQSGDAFEVSFVPIGLPVDPSGSMVNAGVFGARYVDSNRQNISCAYNSISGFFCDYNNSSTTSRLVWWTTIDFTVVNAREYRCCISNSPAARSVVMDVNGERDAQSSTVANSDSFACAGSAWIFGTNGSSDWQLAKMRFERVKVWREGVLSCDIVPVKRLADGKPGAYDFVRETFLVNAASGDDFLLPPEEPPAEYERVPCIVGTGEQYIDTGYTLGGGDGFEMRVAPIAVPASGNMGIFGARNDGVNNQNITFFINSHRDIGLDYSNSDYTIARLLALDIASCTRHHWLVVTNSPAIRTLAVNVGLAPSFYSNTTEYHNQFACAGTAWLFDVNGVNWARAKMYFGGGKVWRGEQLVCDFVPVKRLADGKPGVYDLIRGRFLVNAGNGEDFKFKVAPLKFVRYVESDGATSTPGEYVLLDYTPSSNSVVEARATFLDETSQHTVFCSRNSSSGNSFTLFYLPAMGGLRWDYKSVIQQYGSKGLTNGVARIRATSLGVWVNGAAVPNLATTPQSFTPENRMVLFASYQADAGTVPVANGNYAKMRLYSFKAYDDDGATLKVDMYPCVDEVGQVGLFDNVSGEIFYNFKCGKAFVASAEEAPGPGACGMTIIIR